MSKALMSITDIWAAGCILAEFATNRVLFYGRNNRDQLQQIAAVLGTPNDEQLSLCCPGMAVNAKKFGEVRGARDWMAVLQRHNPTVEDNCADLLRQVVRYEAALRLDGQAACNHPFYDSIRDPTQRLPNGRLLPVLLVHP
jgi:serine/threonine protein kinase